MLGSFASFVPHDGEDDDLYPCLMSKATVNDFFYEFDDSDCGPLVVRATGSRPIVIHLDACWVLFVQEIGISAAYVEGSVIDWENHCIRLCDEVGSVSEM